MKVFVDYKLNSSGKGNFLRRLIPALRKMGVICRFKPNKCDVALGVAKWKTQTNLPKILRVDGIHLSGGNKKISKSINISDLVVFQSYFAKRYITAKTTVKRKSIVIYNGANPEDYSDEYERSGYLMAAHWGNRKHKRPDLHIKYAEDNPDKTFYLAGNCKYGFPKNVIKIGEVSQKTLAQYQSKCLGLVYLADIDWCPNVVVESIVAGMQIISNPECSAVSEIKKIPKKHLYISEIARQYKKAFERVVNVR